MKRQLKLIKTVLDHIEKEKPLKIKKRVTEETNFGGMDLGKTVNPNKETEISVKTLKRFAGDFIMESKLISISNHLFVEKLKEFEEKWGDKN